MFDLGDLLNLIRMTELELQQLQRDLDGDDEEAQDNAGEIIFQMDKLADKLKAEYEKKYTADSGYPSYEEHMSSIRGVIS